MKTRLSAAVALIGFAFVVQGCFTSHPISNVSAATFTPYPKWYGQPYAYAPYDPNGTYYYQPYQYPYPYYYEGYYDHDCGEVPCRGRATYLLKPPLEAKAEPVMTPPEAKPQTAPAQHPGATAAPRSKNSEPK